LRAIKKKKERPHQCHFLKSSWILFQNRKKIGNRTVTKKQKQKGATNGIE